MENFLRSGGSQGKSGKMKIEKSGHPVTVQTKWAIPNS